MFSIVGHSSLVALNSSDFLITHGDLGETRISFCGIAIIFKNSRVSDLTRRKCMARLIFESINVICMPMNRFYDRNVLKVIALSGG